MKKDMETRDMEIKDTGIKDMAGTLLIHVAMDVS